MPFLTFLSLSFLPFCNAICYYPVGLRRAPQDVPCLGGTDPTFCCAPAYTCLSNGLCMEKNETHDALSVDKYVRGSCTDQTWRAAGCPSFCIRRTGALGSE